jgi:hypothetical protein
VLTEFVNWRLDLIMLVAVASSPAIGLYVVALRLSDITSIGFLSLRRPNA